MKQEVLLPSTKDFALVMQSGTARQTESPAIIVGLQRITTSLWFMSLRYRNVYRSIVTGLKVEL